MPIDSPLSRAKYWQFCRWPWLPNIIQWRRVAGLVNFIEYGWFISNIDIDCYCLRFRSYPHYRMSQNDKLLCDKLIIIYRRIAFRTFSIDSVDNLAIIKHWTDSHKIYNNAKCRFKILQLHWFAKFDV